MYFLFSSVELYNWNSREKNQFDKQPRLDFTYNLRERATHSLAEEEGGARAHARAFSGMNTNVEDGGGGRWEGGERN